MKNGGYSMNLIYAYKKKSQNKIVYVGQTIQLDERHKKHMLYDPYNKNTREYNYPLSRGIRKYGIDEYELIILEDNIPLEELDDREKYWIKYYNTYWNGYNQTVGGAFPTRPIYPDDIILLAINMLQNEDFSYKDIQEKTGLSLTHIYNINVGKRRLQPNITYPIRKNNVKGTKGLKFSPEQAELIHQALLNSNKDFKQLSIEFGCSEGTISEINQGNVKAYYSSNYTYPIRPHPHSNAKKFYWENINK